MRTEPDVLVAVQRHGLAAGEVLAGAVLELVAGDLAVPVPIGFQLPPRPVVHRPEGGALGVDGDGDLFGALDAAGGGGDGNGSLAHEVLRDGHLAVFVHLHRLVIRLVGQLSVLVRLHVQLGGLALIGDGDGAVLDGNGGCGLLRDAHRSGLVAAGGAFLMLQAGLGGGRFLVDDPLELVGMGWGRPQ